MGASILMDNTRMTEERKGWYGFKEPPNFVKEEVWVSVLGEGD